MIKKISIFIFFLLFFESFAQQKDLYFFSDLNLGVPISKYDGNKQILRNRFFSTNLSGHLGMQMRFWNRVGLELGFGQHYEYIGIKDKNFPSRNEGFEVKGSMRNSYMNTQALLQFLQPIDPAVNLYLNLGYSLNWMGRSYTSDSVFYVKGKEAISLKSTYKNNTSLFAELGLEFALENDNVLGVGLKYNMGQSPMMTGDYLIQSEGTTVLQDKISSFGNFMALTVRYGILLWHKEGFEKQFNIDEIMSKAKLENQQKETKKEPKKETKKTPSAVTVEGREVKIAEKITVKNKVVTIKIWDHEVEDGDIVSIKLNSNWVLQNYTLENKKKEFKVELFPGDNFLVLHAHNLGKFPPNTAAIIVLDGTKENKIILQSSLNESGTIKINLK